MTDATTTLQPDQAAPGAKRVQFFSDPTMDFLTKTMLGRMSAGGGDAGEVLSTIESIVEGDAESWVRAWEAVGDRLASIGDDCRAKGHLVSARGAYLRAANYYAACVQMADGSADPDATIDRTFRSHRQRMQDHLDLLDEPPEQLAIPYEDTTMPGWFFRAPSHLTAGRPAPTLVLNNGSDGALTTMWPGYGGQALERGYNVLMFDGPGQQSMLFERGIPFRHDWEHVLTPVVDLLVERADVDAERLALYGISQGGYWVPRALAFEHRFAAAVADGGVVDVGATWRANLPGPVVALLDEGRSEEFNQLLALAPPAQARVLAWRAKPYAMPSLYDTFVEVQKYRIDADLAHRITTPVLITDPDEEQFFPGQPQQLFDLLTGPKQIIRFTAAEGAAGHCQPMARQLTAQRMLDFLDETLAGERTTGTQP